MNDFEFVELFLDQSPSSFILLFAFVTAYFFAFRRPSIFSPLFLAVLAHASSAAAITFVLMYGRLRDSYFWIFTVTEAAFIVGFLFANRLARIRMEKSTTLAPTRGRLSFMTYYWVHFAMLALIQVAVISTVGLIIFQDVSRLTIFRDYGYLSWLYDGLLLSAPYLWFVKRYAIERSGSDWIVLTLIFLALLVKGGKSDVAFILWGGYLAYSVYANPEIRKALYTTTLAVLVGVVGATILTINTFSSEVAPFALILSRVLVFGNAFFMGFDDGFIASLGDFNFWAYLFSPIFSILEKISLIDGGEKKILGFEMYAYYYGVYSDTGPNARHNIVGYLGLGIGGAGLFSFVCGTMLGAFSQIFPNDRTHLANVPLAMLSLFSVFLAIDPSLFVGYSLKMVVTFSMCLAITAVMVFIRQNLGRLGRTLGYL